MSELKQSFLIISRAFRKKPLMYFLIIASQIVSILTIFFAMGIIANAYTNFENASDSERTFFITLTDRYNEEDISDEERYSIGAIPFKEFDEKFDEILNIIGDNLEEIAIWGDYTFNDKSYGYSSWYYGEKQEHGLYEVAIRSDYYKPGDTIVFGNAEYSIVTKSMTRAIAFLNYKGTPDDATVYEFYFTTKKILMYDEFQKVENKIDELFDYTICEKPETPKLLDIQMNNTQLSLSAVLIVVVVVDCALCYLFLYESRKKTFAIHRICGAQRSFCITTCFLEALAYMALSFGVAFLIFKTALKDVIVKYYPNATIAYTAENYKWVLSGYFVATVLVMGVCILLSVARPIVEERK